MMSYEDIINLFDKISFDIISSALSPIKVSADPINSEVLLESIKEWLIMPLYGIFVPFRDALVTNIHKLLELPIIAPKTRLAFEKTFRGCPSCPCWFHILSQYIDYYFW